VSAVFEVEKLLADVAPNRRYHQFLRIPAMSSGIYVLPAGATDKQTPHKQDEIYYLVRGKAKIIIGAEEHSVGEGSVIFVEAGREHRFFNVEQELVVLVIFAPAESS
jgi:mannose-6-phosphate isomerase-like protein (cupin superfamily)